MSKDQTDAAKRELISQLRRKNVKHLRFKVAGGFLYHNSTSSIVYLNTLIL